MMAHQHEGRERGLGTEVMLGARDSVCITTRGVQCMNVQQSSDVELI